MPVYNNHNDDDSISEKQKDVYFEETSDTARAELPDSLKGLPKEELAVLEKKLVRRIDVRLLPILVIMYILNYLDRNNIASARLAGKVGMQKELNMTSTQFSVCCPPAYYPAEINTDHHRPASASCSSVTLSCKCHPT